MLHPAPPEPPWLDEAAEVMGVSRGAAPPPAVAAT